MVLEHAWIQVHPDGADAYAEAVAAARPFIEGAPGCHGIELRQQIEDPTRFVLLVRWDSVEAHMEFRDSPAFESWRGLTHSHYASPVEVTHFNEPLSLS
jgi:heme-degrading monooxygenase HmoA